MPTLILQSKAGETFGSLIGVTAFTYKPIMQSANEISFTVPKYINGNINKDWDYIVDFKTIYIPEYEEKYQIVVSYSDDEQETKSIIGTSLCECELGQTIIRNLEVNTESDIKRDDYVLTTFYNESNHKASLLHRVFSEKLSHYIIGHVDDTLKDLAFEYSVSEKDVYGFLTGDVATNMQCLFLFDSLTRTINVYDLCSTCNDCYDEIIGKPSSEWKHYRGDFHDYCPNCGSTNIKNGYGIDTTILVDKENLATSITTESNTDNLKNCFYVEGGDDTINAAFILANPNGSQYVYYFSTEMLDDMPDDFVSAVNEYNSKYNDYYSTHEINSASTTHTYNSDTNTMSSVAFKPSMPDSNYVSQFNSVISQISSLSAESPYKDYASCTSPTKFIGQSALVNGYYNGIDIEGFIQTSMMPDYEPTEYNKYHALSLLSAANFGTIAISGFGNGTTKTVVDNAVLQMAKAIINTGMYSVDIDSSTYTSGSSSWSGTFVITDLRNSDTTTNTITNLTYAEIATLEDVTVTDIIPASVSLTINGDYLTYSKNKIDYLLSKEDLPTATDLYSADTSLNDFTAQIQLHSIDNLNLFYNVLSSCADVLQEEMDAVTDKTSAAYIQMRTYYNLYRAKMTAITTLLSTRTTQINAVVKFKVLMLAYISEVQTQLNFKDFLDKYTIDHNLDINLWNIFNYYRREDTYKNENIISTNLETNAEILQYAGYLMNFAKKELINAATPQITVSTSLNNLLAIKEFEPLLDSFDVGNWIRVRTDIRDDSENDSIYKLRLVSYEIRFDEIQTINVEFSTVTNTLSGLTDAKNIIESAKNMATSYNGVVKQVEKSETAVATVNGWVSDGLNLTSQKIISDAVNQTLVIDEHGLLARKYYDLSDTYDACQLKFFNNGLYTTHNNWATIDTGIGKIAYTDPKTGNIVNDYGIIAKKIIGTQILGEGMGFYNANGSLEFTENGLIISNGKNTVTIDPTNDNKLFKITNSVNTDVFYTDANGNLVMSGTVNTTGGTFSGDITCYGTISGGTINGTNINGGTISGGTISGADIIGGALDIGNTETTKLTYSDKNGLELRGNIFINNSLMMYHDDGGSGYGGKYVKAMSWEYSTEEWKLAIGSGETTVQINQRFEMNGSTIVGSYGGTFDSFIDINLRGSYITAKTASDNETSYKIIGISASNNLHVGNGLYDNSISVDTYVSAGQDLYLRPRGDIIFRRGGTVKGTLSLSSMIFNVDVISNGISMASLNAKLASLDAKLESLGARLEAVEAKV